MKSEDYRELARQQERASAVMLQDINPENPQHKILLGLFGRLNATLYTAVADVIQATELSQLSPMDKKLSRNHRLRMASIRGDAAAVDAILEEMTDEATPAKPEPADAGN